jgi:hypothetical protein
MHLDGRQINCQPTLGMLNPTNHFVSFRRAAAVASMLPLRSAGFNSPDEGPSLLAAAFFSLSVSAGLTSLVLLSSSSLSPRLKGSWSSGSGFGATEVRGCHFLPPDFPWPDWLLGEGLR